MLTSSGVFGGFVVTKLDIWCGEEWSKQDWCYDGCPCFEEVNEGSRAGEPL